MDCRSGNRINETQPGRIHQELVRNNSRRKTCRSCSDYDNDFEDETDPEAINDPLLERILSRAFQKLKPECQTVLTLFADGRTYEEIALRLNHTSETYARRKKYLCKEALIGFVKEDPEYQEYLRFLK